MGEDMKGKIKKIWWDKFPIVKDADRGLLVLKITTLTTIMSKARINNKWAKIVRQECFGIYLIVLNKVGCVQCL